MKTEINATNFNGGLFLVGNYSGKPSQCIKQSKKTIEKLIKPKNWNLYIWQDFSENKINFACEDVNTFQKSKTAISQISIPITSKKSKYVDAARGTIEKYDKTLKDNEQKKWVLKQKQHKKEDILNIMLTILYSPFFIVNDVLHSINPKWANKFEENVMDKII